MQTDFGEFNSREDRTLGVDLLAIGTDCYLLAGRFLVRFVHIVISGLRSKKEYRRTVLSAIQRYKFKRLFTLNQAIVSVLQQQFPKKYEV